MKDIKLQLLNGLQDKLTNTGFKLIKSKDGFVRRTAFGQQWFTFLFYTYENKKGVEVNPVVQIRFEEVEQIFHETSTFSEKDSKGTSTIGCSIENYLGNNVDTYRKYIVDEGDIDTACTFFYQLYEDIAEEFYSNFSSLKKLDHLINSNPESNLALIHPIFRGTKGLIIDYLLGYEKSKFLKKVYFDFYTDFAGGFYKGDYLEVKKNLDSR